MKIIRTIKARTVEVFFIFTFLFSTATAQEAIIAAGVDVSGKGGSVSYSVGQVVYQFHNDTNGSLSEGVQQSYRILALPVIKEARRVYLSFTAFPNPATDHLILKVENFDHENLSFQVIDLYGRILDNRKITGSQTQIDMGNFVSATYFVNVFLDNQLVKAFKIIKS